MVTKSEVNVTKKRSRLNRLNKKWGAKMEGRASIVYETQKTVAQKEIEFGLGAVIIIVLIIILI